MTELEPSYQNEDRAEPNMPDSDYDELPDVDEPALESPTAVDGAHDRLVNYIPFSSIHGPSINFKAQKRRVFIPGEDIKVRIIDYERNVTSHLLSPNLYTIKLQHGDFTWIIKKRYKHIHHLHQQLQLFRASLNIPFPTRNHRERRTSFKADKGQSCKRALPRLPNKPEALVSYENIEHRIKQLEEYLQNLLQIGLYRNYYETVLFLEVSHLSFVRDLGMKGKEGMVLKRTGSTQPGKAGCNFCGLLNQTVCVRCSYFCSDLCGTWRYRWLFVKDTYLGYIRPKDGLVKCVMLFDTGFEVSSGIYAGGMAQGLQIINHSRQIIIKCWTKRKRKEWLTFLKEVASGPARFFTQINRYHSFAPERSSLEASWFVDGCSYMSAIADALEKAREEIYIADWWLSPEIYMKRPMIDGDHWRLDKILQRKAAEGVRIFVLLYKEIELALGINSYYSKQRLVSSHENIKVLRHPDHAKAGVFLWAHHEKIVVIDQTYAFLGGIDLCYGRWDDHEHRLTDLGSVSQNLGLFAPMLKSRKTSSHPAVDSCGAPRALRQLAVATNTVGIGVLSTSQPTLSSATDHMAQPPGISVPELKRGDKILMGPTTPAQQENDPETVKCNTPDTERKNLFERVREKTENAKQRGKQFMSWLNPGSEEEEEIEVKNADVLPLANNTEVEVVATEEEILKIDQNEKDVEAHPNTIVNDEEYGDYKTKDENKTKDLTGMAKYWLGKDYTNFIVKDFNNLDQPYQDLVDRKATPRMPWHDVGVLVVGEAARDVARHFIQRWNAIKLEKAALNPVYPYLLPKTYENLGNLCFSRIGDVPMHLVNCQVLRSVCSWSSGFLDADTVEESIHEAYIDVIIKAKHYIYIENQFFISLVGQSSAVRNRICETLCDRIYAAYKKQEVFRVYVVMPLLPGFEGELGTPTGTALHAITHWNYASICRGKEALLTKLKELGVQDADDYISFYGLRNHSVLNGELVSELIYVHSKLLIADDSIVICGSANINDRSMIGKRDSEIAVVIQDVDFEAGTMNGQPHQCGRYAGSLRKHLFKEHLGLLESNKVQDLLIDVSDPVCEHFYRNVWMAIATSNTQIFEEVFKCIPSNNVRNFQELRGFQEQLALCHTDPLSASRKLEEIRGHLVELPLNFLKNEVLTPNAGTVECMMPTALWT